jgi:hypothetical protein
VFRKKVSRGQLLNFLSAQPRAVVAMEACATAHDWGRAIKKLGHEVRLIPPIYVKPFVRRHKYDAADAEAIAEAASRPSMRFVALKSEDQQAQAMLFRTRDLLVRQRTQLVNALRGHLAEHGIVAAYGLAEVKVLAAAVGDGSVHPRRRSVCRPCRGSAPSPPLRSTLLRHRWSPFGGGVTSRPGSASFLDNTRPEANRDWAGRRRWDSVTSAAC